MQEDQAVRFGLYHLNGPRGPLLRKSLPVNLPPKALAVLWELVTRAGQVVTKEELFTKIWAGTAVGDDTLTSFIRLLRRALKDDSRRPRYIATVHRQGYRFIAPLSSAPPVASSRSAVVRSQPSPSPRRPLTIGHWQLTTPFVGREAELAQLHSLFTKALSGERQIVFVTGEAGIGKTTLVETFLRSIGHWELGVGLPPPPLLEPNSQSLKPTPWVAWGQCIEQYGVGEAYLPVLEALGRLSRQPDGERLVAILQQYAPTWLAQLPVLLDPAALETVQRRVQGVTRERMLREAAEALDLVTAERPLVLVFEDLHWSDPSTVELLAMLARRREAARLVVVGTYRPVDLVVTNHPLKALKQELVARGQGTEVLLGNLSREAVHTYVTRRLGQPATQREVAAFVHKRTEGHPLFMARITDYLAQQDLSQALLPEVTQKIPHELQQLIEVQLERLGDEAQQVLEVASVTGAEFATASVAAGLRRTVDEVELICEELARNGQFIEERGLMEWPDGTLSGGYGFRHALYQQVLYRRIAEARRVRLHQVIGEQQEAAYGRQAGDIAATLAMHFERGRDYQRAVQYFSLAVKTALDRSAYQEASLLITRAFELLKLWPDTQERIQQELSLQFRLASVLMTTKGYASAEVEEAFARTRLLCQQARNAEYLLPALRGLWAFEFIRGDVLTAHTLAQQVLTLAQDRADAVSLLEAHQSLGHTLFIQGELVPAQEQLHISMSMYDPEKYPAHLAMYGRDPKVVSLLYEALILAFGGYRQQALQCCAAARARAEEIQHPFSQVFALIYTARTQQFLRDVRMTHEWTQAGIALASEYGFQHWKRRTETLLDWIRVAQTPNQERTFLDQQNKWTKQAMALGSWATYEYALIAEAYGRFGHAESGLAVVQEGLAIANTRGERFYEAELWRLKGELLLTQER